MSADNDENNITDPGISLDFGDGPDEDSREEQSEQPEHTHTEHTHTEQHQEHTHTEQHQEHTHTEQHPPEQISAEEPITFNPPDMSELAGSDIAEVNPEDEQHSSPQIGGLDFDLNSAKNKLDMVKRKIAESTGTLESINQQISVYEDRVERDEQHLEDLKRLIIQAQEELKKQGEVNLQKRQELQTLEADTHKNESEIISQREQIRVLKESIEITEEKNRQTIELEEANYHNKMKQMKSEFSSNREEMQHHFEVFKTNIENEKREFKEKFEDEKKRQIRLFEVDVEKRKYRADEEIKRTLDDGRAKNEALVKAAEATALEVHQESESAAKRLVLDANQKASELIRGSQIEAEEIRRKTHNAEVQFLKEKNISMAEMKQSINKAKEDAVKIIEEANSKAKLLVEQTDRANEEKTIQANSDISKARKLAEQQTNEYIQKSRESLMERVKEQEEILAKKAKDTDEYVKFERENLQREVDRSLTEARERSQIIIEGANNEKNYKIEELKALETTMFHSAKQSATVITGEAEEISLQIVEEARSRAANIESTVEGIIDEANDEAAEIKAQVIAYSDRIRRELPDPEKWEEELERIRVDERNNLHNLIEPTIKNYLKAIDMAVSKIFVDLPVRYQNNKVIQSFAEAIQGIQSKKNQMNFAALIPKSNKIDRGRASEDYSHPPLKKGS